MKLREFYNEIGGNYDEVIGRLMNEKRIYKYLFKFQNNDDYENMTASLENENWEDAFRFSHNLKGMGLNLGLGAMADAAVDVCEALRNGKPEKDITDMLSRLKTKYDSTLQAIGTLNADDAE